jgi:chemosensory pili system protein ChpC
MSDLRDELYSLLVPLAGERLIVPRACVAEVISYQAPAEMTNAPPWYAGLVSWSGRSVPIVSFEGAFGQALPTVSSRTRIVIFHAAGGKLQSGYFGMLTQGFPQLVRVNADGSGRTRRAASRSGRRSFARYAWSMKRRSSPIYSVSSK